MSNWREFLAVFLGTIIVGLIARLKGVKKMTEKEIVTAPIGPETKIELKMKDGALVVEVEYQGADGYGSIAVGVKPDAFIDKLKAAIPGTLDDMVLEALKAAMK